MANQFKAHWFSHSSIGDFLKCPKAYYWRNVYKNKNNRKVSIVSPYLSLGVALHDTLEPLAYIKAEDRLNEDLKSQYLDNFSKFTGEKGGFTSRDSEEDFKERGLNMIKSVIDNPGPITRPALRMFSKDKKNELPWLWLSEKDELIMSGRCDWLEWDGSGILIGDFKTGKTIESDNSLQLLIYTVLLNHFKPTKKVSGAWYWYLARQEIVHKSLPTVKESIDKLLDTVYPIKEARIAKEFKCRYNGCRNCDPYERLAKGEGKYLGVGGYGQELYIL